jgi:acetylornithine deacetylase/succinyl-diaminopimelate desuccinylase-like protein
MREPVVSADSTTTDLREVVHNLMPALQRDLTELVKIESVNAPTTISEVTRARAAIIDLFRKAEITQAQELVLEHEGKKTTPLVYADHPGPPGAPVVLLYAHYDVQPGGEGWTVTSPFTPLERDVDGDTRLYGRGAADDKSGVCLHLAAVRAFKALPVHLKLVFEGEEEVGTGVLEDYLLANPTDDRFKADLVVVADTGNVRCGEPTLTVSLRGLVAVDVTVSALERPVHSGMYGGPAPDAFMALVRMLATLQDPAGDVAVAGLAKDTMSWPVVTEPQFRADAGVLPSVTLIGTDSIEKRLYGKPSINVVGLDGVPPMSKATNALSPKATARVSMRLAPSQDPDTARTLLVNHLRHVAPWVSRWRSPQQAKDSASPPRPMAPTSRPPRTPSRRRTGLTRSLTPARAGRSRWYTPCRWSTPRLTSCCGVARNRALPFMALTKASVTTSSNPWL